MLGLCLTIFGTMLDHFQPLLMAKELLSVRLVLDAPPQRVAAALDKAIESPASFGCGPQKKPVLKRPLQNSAINALIHLRCERHLKTYSELV